jgi:GNAT superfamily N-acetyltransferase
MPLAPTHSYSGFDCGNSAINTILTAGIVQDHIKRIFVAVDINQHIAGFYTISATSVEFENKPVTMPDNQIDYPLPAALINYLAVDKKSSRRGVGANLLIDALQRIESASAETGITLVLAEAPTPGARSYYLHFGFIPVSGRPTCLYMTKAMITELFKEQDNL